MIVMSRSAARFWWKKELPKHIISLSREFPLEEWKEYTIADRNAERKKKQELNIAKKRYCHIKVPCYIYVFYNDTDWFFSGWYIIVKSFHGEWYLNWKTYYKHKNFFPRIKQHLNFGLLPYDDDAVWFNEFCKKHPMKPKWIQRPRGKYLTHCIIDSYNNLIDICLNEEKTWK